MTDAFMSTTTVQLLMPELVLIALATWTYVGGAFTAGTNRTAWSICALVGLGLVAIALFTQDAALGVFKSGTVVDVRGPLVIDYFGHAMRWVVLLVGFLMVLLTSRSGPDGLSTEYLGSLLLVIAGLMILCTAGDLILIFAGLELISIPTYILLFLGRRDAASQEATTKYFFLSILSSALLLYGLSFLYGVSGSTRLVDIRQVLLDGPNSGIASLLPLALVLVLAGLGFRLAAVPFHFYAPDVYQGTTSANAGLLAIAPKIAALVGLLRLVAFAMPNLEQVAWQAIIVIAIATMTLGNVLALWQTNVRRLLAYSSIAHAGYMLIGFAVGLAVMGGAELSGSFDGFGAMLFYLFVYALASTGVFAALTYLSRSTGEIESIDEMAGLAKTHPISAVAIAIFMFSLAGVPPLGGFWGKLALLFGALNVDVAGGPLRSWFLTLAIVAALNAAIAAAYYLRLVAVMFFRDPVNVPRAEGGSGAWVATIASAVLVLVAGLSPGLLFEVSNSASQAVRLPTIELPAAIHAGATPKGPVGDSSGATKLPLTARR